MKIANPIYDVVFKYLMEDLKVARTFLSILIGKQITKLQVLPQELSADKDKEKDASQEVQSQPNLSIYRLDFSAHVTTASGEEEIIIIEVQKARIYSDSMRFRRYLGKQYMNSQLFTLDHSAKGKVRKYGLPIMSVYFLGESLKGLEDRPVLRIHNQLIDRYSGQVLPNNDKLLRSLYHEGIIVTIPALKPGRRDELEQLLAIFDQSNHTDTMNILNIKVEDYPPKLHSILRRLQKAVEEKEIRRGMDIEDEFLRDLEEYEERIERAERRNEELQRQKEEAQRQKEEAQRQKEVAQRQKEEAILLMLQSSLSKQKISESLGISLEEIEEIALRERKK